MEYFQLSYTATINFFTSRNAPSDNNQRVRSESSTGSSILTRWLRDLRSVSRADPAAGKKCPDRPPATSITRSQSTYLTEGRGQRRKKNAEHRRYSFNDHRVANSLQRKKRTRTNGSEAPTKPLHSARDVSLDNTMMPSRSTPNLQQQPPRENKLYAYYDQSPNRDEDSPPPAPPVRDSSSLKSVKYGPGHEKFPSWPVPSAAETPQALRAPPSGGSHRSKSWTDHTNYPKEKVVTYTRPYMKRQHSTHAQQKLKTVMERCEKIPPEVYDSRYDKINDRLYLPHVDRDGKQLGDMDYMVPSPPERDTCKPQLTQADLEEYARSYQDPSVEKYGQYSPVSEAGLEDFIKYARNYEDSLFPHINQKHDETMLMLSHQKQLSYAQSEGYHSYVSSTDSTSTPFLDRLRRDSEMVATRHSTSWEDVHDNNNRREGRDSVVTTSSGSASSSETLKWHGSMSDVSVASSSCTHLTSNKQLIAHSARVQTPQRHHSESVLYMGSEVQDGWKDRESRNNNTNKFKLFPVNTYTVQENQTSNNNNNNNSNSRSNNSLSVADRINELEKQQKYSYLDPDKKHKIPDPTLKAIQKKALLSFYERHQTSSKGSWRSEPQLAQNLQTVPQPPPRIKVQLPSRRASSASDYVSNNTSKRSSLVSNRESKLSDSGGKITPKHQHSNSCGSLSTDLLGPVIVGPSISLDDWVPEKPPERPPKNPHLRTAYPDLFQNQRVPSPDLPPPSPPTVLEDEVFHTDEPLPPPPPDLETTDWQQEFQERLKENTTSRQMPAPQVETRTAAPEDIPQIKQPLAPERGSARYSSTRGEQKSARELLGIQRGYERSSARFPGTNKLVLNGSVAVSQKIGNGEQFKLEPMRAEPLTDKTRTVLRDISTKSPGEICKNPQRASIAEGTTRDVPPPLQPRQMRINQSMRARISDDRCKGVVLRMSPAKDEKGKDGRPLSYTMSQSKASYLASRRERERIVPDSDTGSYKRTLSPNGHELNDTFTEPDRLKSQEPPWSNRPSKDTLLKNNNVNILRRASMIDKTNKFNEKDLIKKPQLALPDVLPVNAKFISSRYMMRPTQLSLAPVDVEDIKKSPPSSPPKSPFSPLRGTNLSSPPLTKPVSPASPKIITPVPTLSTSPKLITPLPKIRPSLSPSSPKKSSPIRRISPASNISTPLRTSPLSSTSSSLNISPPHSPKQLDPPKVLEGLQLMQRTEVILRVNAGTTDASSQTEKEEPSQTPLPTRRKLQEEIDCEKLSEDFVNQLPTSDKLKDLLVQGPDYKKPSDYVTGLFRLEVTSRPRPVNSPFRSQNTTPSSTPPPTALSTIKNSELIAPPPLEPANPLSATSPYFTTSEPKARFMTRYSQDMNHLNIVKDTKDLSQKKEELVNRLDKKLQVLRSEQLVVSDECKVNDALGENVESHVSKLARPHEAAKFCLHVEEVGKITSLLLGLSGRLARAENALLIMSENHPERRILETKRDKLLEQLGEAKKLKESIDKRSVSVANILYKYLNSDEYADYDHFINMKAKLIMDSKEISDKIKLGEEQLMALKETLIISE